jgi:D-proline reductase (dithiol) PrdB
MEPIRYVEELERYYKSQGFPPYRWTLHESAPLTPLRKPLHECRVSMLTSGGVSHCSAPAWNPAARNDLRLDEVAPCVFPIDRLRELAADGVIGSVAARLWSGFMGRIYKRSLVVEQAAPALARELEKDQVDLFLLVPA